MGAGSRGLEEEERSSGETGAGHKVRGQKRPGTRDWVWPVTREGGGSREGRGQAAWGLAKRRPELGLRSTAMEEPLPFAPSEDPAPPFSTSGRCRRLPGLEGPWSGGTEGPRTWTSPVWTHRRRSR